MREVDGQSVLVAMAFEELVNDILDQTTEPEFGWNGLSRLGYAARLALIRESAERLRKKALGHVDA